MKNKVAIIIPTMDRIDFALRAIKYYSSVQSSHPIFIGDASDDSSEEIISKFVPENLDVKYFHWKKLGVRKTLIRLGQEASKENKYCAFHCDDDFFIPRSLSKCASFLGANPEYATAQGKSILITLDQSGPYGNIKSLGSYWDKKEALGETALDRLNEITSSYWVPIFSVHRINEFVEDMSNGVDTVTDRGFGEYINSLTFAMRGKSKHIDCLYLVRHIHDRRDHPSLHDWVTSSEWYSSYCSFIETLSNTLMSTSDMQKETSRMIVKGAVRSLFLTNNKDCFLGAQCIRYYLKKTGIYTLVRKLYNAAMFISALFPNEKFDLQCMMSKRSKYFVDFNHILTSLKKQ